MEIAQARIAHMNCFQNVYPDPPINSGSQEIRIFELLPGLDGSEISGRLVRYDILESNTTISYEALSYRWGTTMEARTIRMGQNLEFKVTAALETALQMLRSSEKARMLWIDAICINQGDVQEKNRQVQMMRRIYMNARSVQIWLDVYIDPTCAAMIKLQNLNDQSTEKDLGDDPSFWDPLGAVFKDHYWMRVWIQQEISNAKSLAIQCRRVLLPVPSCYHYIRITHDRTAALDFNTPVWLDWLEIRPNLRLPKRFGLVDSSSYPVQGSTLSEGDLSLLVILSSSFKLECTDDRDRLYGVLHLAQDYVEGDIQINYEYSVSEVFTSVVEFMLRKYRSLNFLLYAGINWRDPSRDRMVPTWVPDWRDPCTRTWLSHSPKEYPELSLLIPELSSTISTDGAVLQTYGIRIDRIGRICHMPEGAALYNTPVATFLDICRTILRESVSSRHVPGIQMSDEGVFDIPQWYALVRILSGVDLLKREDSNANIILRGVVTGSADDLVKAHHLLDPKNREQPLMIDVIRPSTPSKSEPGEVFARLAWGVIGKHQPFVGINGGIGMALSSAKVGDDICIIRGCDQPMILRSSEDHYLVVGEGSFDGANRGELLIDISDDIKVGDMIGTYKFESFSLR